MVTRAVRTRAPQDAQKSRLDGILSGRLQLIANPPAAEAPIAKAARKTVANSEPVSFNSDKVFPLTDILDSRVSETRRLRTDPYIHVSDVISKCTRKAAIVHRHKIPPKVQRLSLADSLTFRMGDAVHDVVKERVVESVPTKAWGRWKCRCGHHTIESPCLRSEVPEDTCEKCGTITSVYEEVSVIDAELNMIGHPDLILFLQRHEALYITELKSIAPKHFEELLSAKQDHIIQVLFYWYLMRRAGYRLVDQVSILYVSKGYMFKGDPYKEFLLKPSTLMGRLEPFLEEVRALKASTDGGKLPPRLCCVSKDAPDARKCEVSEICFRGDDAPIAKTVKVSDITRANKPRPRARSVSK